TGGCKRNCVLKRFVTRFNSHSIIDGERDLVIAQRLQGCCHGRQMDQIGIGQNHHSTNPQICQVHSDFSCYSAAKPNARSGHLKRNFLIHRLVSKKESTAEAQRFREWRIEDGGLLWLLAVYALIFDPLSYILVRFLLYVSAPLRFQNFFTRTAERQSDPWQQPYAPDSSQKRCRWRRKR